ncbi:uncharacterized protein BDV14DRAFT_177264 [Aspergillus stella-maris]|uniref:uncharacterized protein n=1 Tax=Aspergillus stella-maris TaxID=1810926 RepID=UPI003CCE3CAF
MYFRLIAVILGLVALMAPASVWALPQPQPQAPTPIPVSPTILRESLFSKEEVEVDAEVELNHNQPRNADWTFDISLLNDTMSETETDGHLQKRHTVDCWRDEYIAADVIPITEGIEYLRKRKGRPDLDPSKCTVVSCSYNAAIYWCNMRPKKFYLPSFNNIADSAQVLKNECWKGDVRRPFGGQVHHKDGWYAGIDGYHWKC